MKFVKDISFIHQFTTNISTNDVTSIESCANEAFKYF